MATFVRGDVVVVPFPFSDLTQTKRRPALVLATLTGDDVILCQITSQAVRDHYSVSLASTDFASGSLQKESNIRPNRLFTADRNILRHKVGVIRSSKLSEVVQRLIAILQVEE